MGELIVDELRALAALSRQQPLVNVVVEGGHPAQRIGAGLLSALQGSWHAFALRGPVLSADEEADLARRLMAGEGVIIVTEDGHATLGELAHSWFRYAEAPRNSWGILFRSAALKPLPLGGECGHLVAVAIRPPEGWARQTDAAFFELSAAHVDVLPQGDLSLVVSIGRPRHEDARAITTRDLCLLHARDPAGTARREFSAIVAASDPLTWTDVQTLLRTPVEGIERTLIESLHRAGRLEDAQLDGFYAARDFLQQRRLESPGGLVVRTHGDIWDVVWDFESTENHDVFRGHADARWPLRPTLLRPRPGETSLRLGDLLERADLTTRFVAELRRRQRDKLGTSLSDLELLAVAQHFGFPTPLLDYTRSLRVAAFFATLEAARLAPGTEQVGAIHRLRLYERLTVARSPGTALGIDVLTMAGLAPGDIKIVEPHLPMEADRLTRQKGLFIAGHSPRDLIRIADEPFYFVQRSGEIFEDPSAGVDAASLLPADDELQALIDEVDAASRRQGKTAVPVGMADTRLDLASLVGAKGARIRWQHFHGEDFFESLDASLEALGTYGDRQSLVAILSSYFETSRIDADVGVPPPLRAGAFGTTVISDAVDRLADWGQVNPDALWKWAARFLRAPNDRPNSTELLASFTSPRARIASACALYLVGWEYLRHVNGDRAVKLFLKAETCLWSSNH